MWGTLISLGASALSAFVSMILSSISATAAESKNYAKAHTYARASALLSGLSTLMLVLAILLVVFHKPIASKLQEQLASLQEVLAQAQKASQ